MIRLQIYRYDNEQLATDFDMGDLEFNFRDKIVSSRGNPCLSNMIYVSLSGLIDGLLKIRAGAKRFEFVGVDSSFVLLFENNKKGIYISHRKNRYGPISLEELLVAINVGIEIFLAEPLNVLPSGGPACTDFNASLTDLRAALA